MTRQPHRPTIVLLLISIICSACRGGHGPTASTVDAPRSSAGPTTSTVASSAAAASSTVSPQWSGTALEPAGAVADGTSHPRLWLTASDLPRFRSWASDSNPAWSKGLSVELQRVNALVDSGADKAGDNGSPGWVEDPVEADAELLAFGSLVDPSPLNRAKDADSARRLLMTGITAAAAGPSDGAAYRSPNFAIDDRSRWWGEGWALTVDWIYPALTAQDKATIRTVFLRWCTEDEQGGQTTSDHPVPIGAQNDPALLADPIALKWAGNNYFTAHARNIALMALALDPRDDPDGRLHAHLANVTGGFLYMTDALLRGEERGGAPAEGFEYGPQSFGYIAETLLALHTSGNDDTARLGQQVSFIGNQFWDDAGRWLLNALSPAPVTGADGQQTWLPAPYGDTQHVHNPDWIEFFGALGIYDESVASNAGRLAMSRWIETQTPDGGLETLNARIGDPASPRDSILYFMLLDPSAAQPADPRPALAPSWFAAGTGHLSARTNWSPTATWFNFAVGWNQVDHQDADGLNISLFRNGEWLTKARSGYDVFTSDQKNTMAIQNDQPEHDDAGDYRQLIASSGSQYTYVPSSPGRVTANSHGADYVYASGDATGLYNSASEGATDVVQATRDVVWLQPDIVVVYDRATTKTPNRFKRFFLQLPSTPTIDGHQAISTTASGQQLAVTTLLPADATEHAEAITPDKDGAVSGEGSGQVADGETMGYRLRVEAPGGPSDVRFLDVLEGLDPKAPAHHPVAVHTVSGSPFDGAVVAGTLVLFPVDAANATDVQLTLPSGLSKVVVTGLQPAAPYGVTIVDGVLRVNHGGSTTADAGGVIELSM